MLAIESASGQISMEFMTYVGILLLIFAIFGPIFFQQAVRINLQREGLEANKIATILEKEINTAIRFGHGYRRNFTLSEEISNSNYSIQIHPEVRLLELKWRDQEVSRQLLGRDFEGSLHPGQNQIRNVRGEIIFN